jgi:hypothetical protein
MTTSLTIRSNAGGDGQATRRQRIDQAIGDKEDRENGRPGKRNEQEPPQHRLGPQQISTSLDF